MIPAVKVLELVLEALLEVKIKLGFKRSNILQRKIEAKLKTLHV